MILDCISVVHLKYAQGADTFSSSWEPCPIPTLTNHTSGFFSQENGLQCRPQTDTSYPAKTTQSYINWRDHPES